MTATKPRVECAEWYPHLGDGDWHATCCPTFDVWASRWDDAYGCLLGHLSLVHPTERAKDDA